MNDHGIHSHNTLRAMYWFAGKMDLCNRFQQEIETGKMTGVNDLLGWIMTQRDDARNNMADLGYRAVIGGDIEEG